MKKLGLLTLFILSTARLLAQDNIELELKATNKDTINLIGVLYTSKGIPARNIIVGSKPNNAYHNGRAITTTDENGQFTLNGIMVDDTLTIESINYDKLTYYNKGSRLMVIFLPQEKINDLNSKSPIVVNAKRSTAKPVIADFSQTKSNQYYVIKSPEFPGGKNKFLDYLAGKIIYPKKAIDNNIEGTVEISFTVGNDGRLNNFSILRGIGYDCENELIKLLANGPSWDPGIMNGVPTPATVSVSVKFALTGN
jgi:TonB family protein